MTVRSLLKQKVGAADLAYLAGCGVAVISIIGWADSLFWMFDLCSHFRVQYFFILLICGGVLATKRHHRGALLLLGVAALNAFEFLPYLAVPGSATAAPQDLTIVVANVNSSNDKHDRFLAVLNKERPDIVVALEIDSRWKQALAATSGTYPYRVIEAREDNFGIALLSRHPLRNTRIRTFDLSEVPSIQATVEDGDQPFTVIATHPLPPGGPAYVAARNEHLGNLAKAAASIEGPLIIAGDLNTTPWNGRFKELVDVSGLHPASKGMGISASWPSHLLPMRIPIDHVLISENFGTASVEVGRGIGSDHRPLTVRLGRNEEENTAQRAGF